MLKNQDYQLYQITLKDYKEVSEFTSINYVANQPLSIHLGVQAKQFSSAFDNFIAQCCCSELSFCFKLSNQIISVILAMPYESYLVPVVCPQKLKPIEIIIQAIENMYKPFNPQKTLSIFIGCTHPVHIGKGLFSRLIFATQKKGQQKGFQQSFAECTSQKSNSVFIKLGYQQKIKIKYSTFQQNGEYLFKNLKGAEYLSIVTKNITHKKTDKNNQENI